MDTSKKREISEKINALLGIDPPIDFRRLKTRDIERLYETLTKIPNLVQAGARASLERVMEGPLVSATKEVLSLPAGRLFDELREQGGFIGIIEKRMRQRRKEPEVKNVTPDKAP